jgi:hypothetical protein
MAVTKEGAGRGRKVEPELEGPNRTSSALSLKDLGGKPPACLFGAVFLPLDIVVSLNCKAVSRCERKVLDSCASMQEGLTISMHTSKNCFACLTALDIEAIGLTVGLSRPYLHPKAVQRVSNAAASSNLVLRLDLDL